MKCFSSIQRRLAALFLALAAPTQLWAQAVSQPAILQIFEAKWDTMEDRMADIFEVGYGQMWLPPPQRADSGNQSVGYDVFDRFDLGKPGNQTLYGTEEGLKSTISSAHDAGVKMYTDFIPNHNGFRNKNTSGFVSQGGYPGFVLSTSGDTFGDFHDPSISYTTNAQTGSLFGLIDIAQEKNHQYIRNPVAAGNPSNIPAGSVWNKVDANNARFYPDTGGAGTPLTDPLTGGAFTRYNFNLASPLAGDAVSENALGLLTRNMQYMIQVIGVDGFRIDAARHMPTTVFNHFDKAVFATSLRTNHDGSIQPIYMFSEVADGSPGAVQPYIRRDLPNKNAISTAETTVKGNRDALDFPLFWAMVNNLSGNGTQNNWHGIRGAAMDNYDRPGGTESWHSDGSQGVMFVDSHDDHAGQRPHLYKVGYAYTLMKPGNTMVYMNAKEFGEGRNFPHDIGGSSYAMSNDALGGYHGEDITKLVEIRNSHGRGDFSERWIDDAFNPNGFSNIYIYERQNSAIVGLNSRLDAGSDVRTPVQTSFAPNTVLVELTGNANNATVDPGNLIPETIRVNASGQLTLRVPRSSNHGKGYVIYGLPTPQGTLSLTNVSSVLEGANPVQSNNGTARLADIDVITGDSFSVQLNTTPVTLAAPLGEMDAYRDVHADGDRAMIMIDGGMDLNGNSAIDGTEPGSVTYGFEDFTNVNEPGYDYQGGTNVGTGFGAYEQEIDARDLSEGRHYITVRAFRHRKSETGGDGGPAVFTDFKRTIYVDRELPVSEIASFGPSASNPNNPNNRDFIVRSLDRTAGTVHVLLDIGAALSDNDILQLVAVPANGTLSGEYDRDLFLKSYNNVITGNHSAAIVTIEPTGTTNIQRFTGLFTDTNIGHGFGDVTGDGFIRANDLNGAGSYLEVLLSQNTVFNAAADYDGDGLVDNRDMFELEDAILASTVDTRVYEAYEEMLMARGDFDTSGQTDPTDLGMIYAALGTTNWLLDLDVDGTVDLDDAQLFITGLLRTTPGDYNMDGLVSSADYTVWRDNLGQSHQADGNFDGTIDEDDFLVWRDAYGAARAPFLPGSGSGSGSAVVPEPGTLIPLLGAAIVSLLTARRRGRAAGIQGRWQN